MFIFQDVRATVKSITYPSDEPGELFLSHDEIGRAGLSMKKETRIKSKRSLPTSFELSKKLGRHRYDSAYSDSEVGRTIFVTLYLLPYKVMSLNEMMITNMLYFLSIT